MKYCRYCGKQEIDDEARYCERCGKPFSNITNEKIDNESECPINLNESTEVLLNNKKQDEGNSTKVVVHSKEELKNLINKGKIGRGTKV